MKHGHASYPGGCRPVIAGRRAFTLVELLVVIAIISILAALLFPSLRNAKDQAKRTQCVSNLKQLALAANLYSDENDDVILPYRVNSSSGDTHFWMWDLFPYLGLKRVTLSGIDAPAYTVYPYPLNVPVFQCPSTTIDVTTVTGTWSDFSYDSSYVKRAGYGASLGVYNVPGSRRSQVKNPSNFVLLADGKAVWMDENAADPGTGYMASAAWRHNNFCNVGALDGHVEPNQRKASSSTPGAMHRWGGKWNWQVDAQVN